MLRHRLRVVFWSFLFAGLTGGFVYYVFRPVVRTPLLAFVATNYASPFPPNAWASEDLSGLQALGQEGRLFEEKRIVDFRDVPSWESKDQWLRQMRQAIDTARPGGPSRDTIIVYLSLHGVVDEKGEPCIVPPGASPWRSSEWVQVRELLNDLFLVEDEKRQYASKIKNWNKLLILDCDRIDANWSLGQFYNGFAQRLSDVVRELNVPKLYVLNSTSPGQLGWSAPELRGSVFGHFLAQGLNGAADVESAGNHNKQVSLRELYGYLKAKVSQWVIQNRDDVQEPMLLPDNAPDIPLVFRRSDEGTVAAEPAKRDQRWDRMAALWEQHAELRAKTPYRGKPMEWADYQHNLLRAEQLLEAGSVYEREFDETVVRLTSQAAALSRVPASPEAVPYNLALAGQWGRLPTGQDLLKLPAPGCPLPKRARWVWPPIILPRTKSPPRTKILPRTKSLPRRTRARVSRPLPRRRQGSRGRNRHSDARGKAGDHCWEAGSFRGKAGRHEPNTRRGETARPRNSAALRLLAGCGSRLEAGPGPPRHGR